MLSSTQAGGTSPISTDGRPVPLALDAVVDAPLARARGRWFALTHFWMPLLVLVLATWELMLRHGDLWLADRIYALEGHRWLFKHSLFTDRIIHVLGHDLSVAAWLGVLVAWIAACGESPLRAWRRPLLYLLLAVALSTTAVAWIKAWSNMDCPWSLTRYGGTRPYVDLISLRPPGLSRGRCFPAGHASSGYAWMSLYFFALLSRPQWRLIGLAAGIALGLLFGLSQQLRGAHFTSHDVWAAGICWITSLGLYLWFAPAAGTAGMSPSPVPVPVAAGEVV